MSDSGPVLVTGANSGIGLATAIEIARRGYTTVGSVRSVEKAETVAIAAQEAGVEVQTTLLDVTDAERSAEVIEEVRPSFVVNNAGFPLVGAIEDVGIDEARGALETMAIAPIRLARLALPHMRTAGGGRIVNVSSIYGRATGPLTGWYQAAKHALEAASDALRAEVAGEGIAVILVQPGGIKTALWEDVRDTVERRRGSRYEDAYERMLQRARLADPFMRSPKDVAKVIAGAVTTRFPRRHYLVGLDAKAAAASDSLLPAVVKDRLTRFGLGL